MAEVFGALRRGIRPTPRVREWAFFLLFPPYLFNPGRYLFVLMDGWMDGWDSHRTVLTEPSAHNPSNTTTDAFNLIHHRIHPPETVAADMTDPGGAAEEGGGGRRAGAGDRRAEPRHQAAQEGGGAGGADGGQARAGGDPGARGGRFLCIYVCM